MTRLFYSFCIFFVLLTHGSIVWASTVYIALNDDQQSSNVVSVLSKAFNTDATIEDIKIVKPEQVASDAGKVVVAIGETALEELLAANGKNFIIAAFISRSTYYRVLEKSNYDPQRITAVFSDPSPILQICLLKAIIGESAAVSVISSSEVSGDLDLAKKSAVALGIPLFSIEIKEKSSVQKIVGDLQGANAILIFRDKALFEKIPLDDLIQEAYENKGLAVIGYSSVIVTNGGGLATTYYSTEDSALSVVSIANKSLIEHTLRQPDYPENFSLIINRHVQKSLGYLQQNEEDIRRRIAEMKVRISK